MSGFLDRLAVRAVGEASLVHPRVRSRFEPVTGELPSGPVEMAGPVEEIAAVEEAAAVPRIEVRRPVAEPTFEPEPPLEAKTRTEEVQLRQDSHPLASSPTRTHARLGERDVNVSSPTPAPVVVNRLVAPPLPGDGNADGRGSRGMRVYKAPQFEGPLHGDERRRPAASSTRTVEPPQPTPLRSRSTPGEALPTVESDRRAPVSTLREEGEPSETIVQVHIGRIDVRASQPPAPERGSARSAGPRLTLTDYLKRREERR